jgi:hypothetical protein
VSKVYGAANTAFTVTCSPYLNGDTSADLVFTSMVFTTAADATSVVGTYADVTPSGITAADYTVSYAAGTLTVTPAPITCTTDYVSKVYGAANPAFTVTCSPYLNGDTSADLVFTSMVFTTAADATSVVGTYADVTPSGITAADYTVSYAAGGRGGGKCSWLVVRVLTSSTWVGK